jgi:hypothetical protein
MDIRFRQSREATYRSMWFTDLPPLPGATFLQEDMDLPLGYVRPVPFHQGSLPMEDTTPRL